MFFLLSEERHTESVNLLVCIFQTSLENDLKSRSNSYVVPLTSLLLYNFSQKQKSILCEVPKHDALLFPPLWREEGRFRKRFLSSLHYRSVFCQCSLIIVIPHHRSPSPLLGNIVLSSITQRKGLEVRKKEKIIAKAGK